MRHLSLDIETYSSADLASVGAYAYAAAEDFQILLLAYAYDADEVRVIDVANDGLPRWMADDLINPEVVKHAFNAGFERVCLSRELCRPGQYLDPML